MTKRKRKFNKLPDEEITKIINNNNDYYEKCLLYLIINDGSFWDSFCKPNINIHKNNSYENFNDFTKPIDNIIYSIINSFYTALSVAGIFNENSKIDKNIITGLLESKLKDGTVSIDDKESILYRLTEINVTCLESDIDTIEDLVNSCFSKWLDTRRVKQIALDALNNNCDIESLLKNIQHSTDNTSKRSTIEKRSIRDILSDYSNPEESDSWDRIPIANLHTLTNVMGGGIKKKEAMLIIAPPGGGKTTASCQIATGLVLSGKKVVYITTEQPDSELLPKMIACGANVLYEKVKDGLMKKDKVSGKMVPVLEPEENEAALKFLNKLDDKLFFENWCDSGGKIKLQLANTVEQYKQLYDVDVVIIDWLGGGINMDAQDGDLKRHFFDECCEIIKNIAVKYNVAIITCSQASSSKSEGIKYITSKEVAENTMLHTYFTWALGISALGINKKGNFNGEVDNTSVRQYFNLFKTRKSKGKAYPVDTDFSYSRFIEAVNEVNIEQKINKDYKKAIEDLNITTDIPSI